LNKFYWLNFVLVELNTKQFIGDLSLVLIHC
jgi:hypothetical protein